jgi:ubiquinone/menaquinone biosynthesis C-methylase UbiE
MSRATKWMDKTFFPDYKNHWDDELFRGIIQEKTTPESFCLDYGAGRGTLSQMNFLGRVTFIAGVDIDDAVLKNPYLNEAKLLNSSNFTIPYSDNKFDVVFSDNVMEHIQNTSIAFNEIFRVLKPGGLFLSKTPNKFHYMPIISRITPTSFHKYYNKIRGRDSEDTFPAFYRCNSKSAVAKHARMSGFEIDCIQFVEGRPEYLRLTTLTYLFGMLYERAVNSTDLLSHFRCVMIFQLRKKSAKNSV